VHECLSRTEFRRRGLVHNDETGSWGNRAAGLLVHGRDDNLDIPPDDLKTGDMETCGLAEWANRTQGRR
jgi:hypothetical protein